MGDAVSGIADHLKRLLSPQSALGGFNFSEAKEKQAAIDYLWAGDFSDCTKEVLLRNPDYEEWLEHKTRNKYMLTKRFDADSARRRMMRLNYTAGMIGRQSNMYYISKHQLLMAIECKHKMCHRLLWEQFSSVRAIPSYNFTEDLV